MDTHDELLRARLTPPGDWTPTTLRHAAVLCPIVALGGDDHLLLVVRPEGLRQHPGQVAFPGGMADPGETPLSTALRECFEEVGVEAAAITVLGSLPPRESSTGILVHCLVARVAPVPLVPDPREVAAVLHVPLTDLRDASRWQERTPPPTATGRQPPSSPHFDLGAHTLWGLTARFVNDLLPHLP